MFDVNEIPLRRVIGQRPRTDTVPRNWVICNAPRPLYGHQEWRGDFMSGIFYVALDPEAEDFASLMLHNKNLHACRIEWVTDAEARGMARRYYEKHERYSMLFAKFVAENSKDRVEDMLRAKFYQRSGVWLEEDK